MKKILGLLLVVGLSVAVMAQEVSNEIVEEKKVEKPTLKGWGSKFFEALDNEVEDTKSFQKKQWEKMKNQFKNIFNRDDKDWEDIDKTMEENNETKEN